MPNVEYKVEGHIGTITINRPQAMNALDPETISELGKTFDAVSSDVRCLIFTGAGKAFIAGADISKMTEMPALEARRFATDGQELTQKMEAMPQPIIAAVNGFALGGGCELALGCDFILAGEKAKFGQPEVTLGIIAGFGGSQRLVDAVGSGWAKRLLYSGEIIDAKKAVEIGLATEVVEQDKLLDRAMELAKKIAANGPIAVAFSKRAVVCGSQLDLHRGLQMEADLFGTVFTTSDRGEGVGAFLEKRPANFKGE